MEPPTEPARPVPPPLGLSGAFTDEPEFIYEEADASTRLLAKFIDGLVAVLIAWVLGMLLPGVASFLGGLVAAAYVLFSDGLDVGFMASRSVGKQVTHLDVRRLDGDFMDLETSARRNWMFALCFLAVPVLRTLLVLVCAGLVAFEVYRMMASEDGRRWGDELAGTKVVRV